MLKKVRAWADKDGVGYAWHTGINLIAENTLEHMMLETLATKMNLAEGVLDGSEKSLS